MNTLMKKAFKSSIITSVFLLILGLLLIIASEATIISISYVIGSILILIGVIGMINYIRSFNSELRNELDLIYGLVTIILGMLIITNPKAIASIIPFILGLIIIISSATKLHYAFQLKSDNNELWKSTLGLSILTTVLGVVLLFNPFSGAVAITKIVGGIIVAYAVLDIISSLTIRKNVMNIQKAIENGVEANITIEAEVISEKEEKPEEVVEEKVEEKKPEKKETKKASSTKKKSSTKKSTKKTTTKKTGDK